MLWNIALPDLLRTILAGLISGVITLRIIPTVNSIARTKGLLNEPGERTSHRYKTPRFGGISIFIAAISTSLFFVSGASMESFKIFYLAAVLTFFTGLKDDIVMVTAEQKLISQVLCAALVVYANHRFTNLFGTFGIYYIDEISSIFLTIFIIIVIMNSINLIDGIDGLASIICSIILGSFGLFFFINGYIDWAILCVSFIGPLVAFFQYNVFGLRNKTFMGDSGSLVLGLFIATCTIQFCEINQFTTLPLTFVPAPAIAFSILVIPIFDTARVFLYRLIHRRSPFSADRNHLHHRLIDLGLHHLQASLILGALNIFIITMAIFLSNYVGIIWISLAIITVMIIFTMVINYLLKRRKAKTA